MKTFVASLIVLLFCLTSVSLAGWEKKRPATYDLSTKRIRFW